MPTVPSKILTSLFVTFALSLSAAQAATLNQATALLEAGHLTQADHVMAQVLAAVPVHGLEAVLVAAELALEAQRPSAEHVLNVLARLKEGMPMIQEWAKPAMALSEEPRADVQRYDTLRGVRP